MIAADKQAHVLGCWALAATVGHHFGPTVGFLASVAVGVVKEVVWDWYLGKGTPDGKDLLADVIGAAVGSASVAFPLR